jgi:hypothetical protein
LDVDTVLKSLGLKEIDVALEDDAKVLPSRHQFESDPELIKRILAFTKFCAEQTPIFVLFLGKHLQDFFFFFLINHNFSTPGSKFS